jgi:transposase-like protein
MTGTPATMRLPGRPNPDLHRASDPQFAGSGELEGRKPLAAALKPIYQAATAEAAEAALQAFSQSEWGKKFPTVAAMWQRQWEQVIPFFAYPPEVRKIIYTTNAIESMHMQLRKIVKNRGHFPSDEVASKLLYLALRNIEKDWKMPPITWRQAVNQFAILFGERFTAAIS